MTRIIMLAPVLVASFVLYVQGHVSLTFPPARTYAWDFLDNARTPRPCGVSTYAGEHAGGHVECAGNC